MSRLWSGLLPAVVSGVCLCIVLGLVHAQDMVSMVRVDVVRSEPLMQTIPAIGRLVALQSGPVAAQVEAPVNELPVQVGDRVERGTVLAQLGTGVLDATHFLAKARVQEANARLVTAREVLTLASQDRERLEALKSTQSTSEALYDDAVQQELIAKARVGEARAALSSATASLRLAALDLDNAEVKAPYSGVVTQRLTEAGAYVRKGDALVWLLSDATLEIEIDVPFERIGGLDVGTHVTLTLGGGESHDAFVRALVPEENRRTRTRAVRITPQFGPTDRPLASGQSVVVYLPQDASRDIVSVHKDAVTRQGGQNLVYVVQDDVAKLRVVTLGEAVGERFEVLSGLEAGDRAVVRGNERLRPDDPVRVAESDS